MRKRKSDRRNQFVEVLEQIQQITNEIYGSTIYVSPLAVADETDLSLRKLEELHRQLHELQKEKVHFFYTVFLSVSVSLNLILSFFPGAYFSFAYRVIG